MPGAELGLTLAGPAALEAAVAATGPGPAKARPATGPAKARPAAGPTSPVAAGPSPVLGEPGTGPTVGSRRRGFAAEQGPPGKVQAALMVYLLNHHGDFLAYPDLFLQLAHVAGSAHAPRTFC